MLYIHRFNTAFYFCLCPQYQNQLVEAWEECFPPHAVKSFCLFSLCISEWCKTQFLFLKKKQYSLESKEDWGLCLQWGNRFSQLVCFILLRLTSLWALYTLKWTLVTLVLMGHYLTYESLRHNQLYFTFKDHLSDGRLSLLPTLSLHTFQG